MTAHFPKELLRIAVIGAGVMGQHHLRICSLLKGIDLVGVVDINDARAKEAGLKYGCQAYSSLEEVVRKVDAVIIAVPTREHAAVGEFFLQNNVHCFIEKPLALTEQECLSLITVSEQKGLVLAVGHTEHYNAGVQELRKLIDKNHTIFSIDVFRLNYNSRRVSDVDVVLDLMIHDLEVVTSLIDASALTIEARAVGQKRSSELNHVFANITFINGAIANLTASRITPNTIRKLQVITDKAYFSLDYQTQELLKFERLSEKIRHAPIGQTNFSDNIVSERLPVRMQDSLMSAISAFMESIIQNEKRYVDGWRALASLKLAWTIQEKAKLAYHNLTSLKKQKAEKTVVMY